MEENGSKYCQKCGTKNDKGALFCISCGNPFPEIKVETANIKKKKISVVPIIVCLVIVVALFFGVSYIKEQKRIDYYNNCVGAYNAMLNGASIAEESCNVICAVWHDSIWKQDDVNTRKYTKDEQGHFFDDFNDALNKLISDEDFLLRLQEMINYTDEAKKYMQAIRNSKVPNQYARLYADIEDMYDYYLDFINLPLYMEGSYNSFSEDFKKIDDLFASKLNKVYSYFE